MTSRWEKIVWYRDRLAAMSPAEVVHRVGEAVKRALGRFGTVATLPPRPGMLPVIPGLRAGLDAWDVPPALAAEWDEARAEAESGRFCLLGQTWPSRPRDQRWHLDPVTGTPWPGDRYCFDIDFRHAPGMGDVKFVWELNRLQYLQPVAALACKRADSGLARFCLAEIESWIDDNPPFKGVNWASGIELAMRLVSIMVVTTLTQEHASDRQRDKIRNTLHAHAAMIDRYPSAFSSANNHRAAEGLGLFLVGALAPTLPGAQAWKRRGWDILCDAAERQILADGVGAEQTITYAAFLLDVAMLGLHVARATDTPVPDEYPRRIERAGECLRWFVDGGGNHPFIGDNDNARVLGVYRRDEAFVRSVLGCVASLTNRPDLMPPALQPHLRQALYGRGPVPAAGPRGVRTFALGGYTVGRHRSGGREILLAMDHGGLGFLSIAAHGHADALALWLHMDDQPVLADAGTYLYHSGGTWRSHFRGTSAHNTLVVAGTDSSRMAGNFNWSRQAQARLIASGTSGERWWAEAEHDGYRQTFGVVHRRRVEVDWSSGFWVHDVLTGTAPRPVEVGFLLHPALRAERHGDAVHVLRGAETLLALAHDGPLAVRIGAAGTPDGGWVSPTFAVKEPASRIVLSGVLAPGRRSTVVFAFPTEARPSPAHTVAEPTPVGHV